MKDIKGFEGLYQIDEKGNVFSLKKLKTLRPSLDSSGYLSISLSLNCKKHTKRVHRLVAETFISNPLNLPQVNHIDGNKLNNHINNLEWSSSVDNIRHAFDNGLCNNSIGEKQHNSKLTEVEVLKIRSLANSMRGSDIAKLFNVKKCCISQIINRKSWKHI